MQILSRETKRSDVRARLREACVLYAKEVSISGVGGRINLTKERFLCLGLHVCWERGPWSIFNTFLLLLLLEPAMTRYLGAADIFSKILQRFEDVEDTSG